MVVLDSLVLDEIKTKAIVKILAALKAGKKALIVLPEPDSKVLLSARNIPGVKTTFVGSLNVYDILNCDTLIVLKDAVAKIEEVYA